jgi:dTDP-glucose 4,6-dehydratase
MMLPSDAGRASSRKTLLITGGCGFIGSNFIRFILSLRPECRVINLDALTYAGNPKNLHDMAGDNGGRYKLIRGDIRDQGLVEAVFKEYRFDGVLHFAAESHVDRSILGPEAFLEVNVLGTFRLLEAARKSWEECGRPEAFRFLHVSTDEVYGSLGAAGFFREDSPYDPSSPYSASKAASDHFVNAYFRTYGLPTLITNCSNNFGHYQFPEKLIPLMILNIFEEKPLPVYGDGRNVRDWLYVEDHCEALLKVFEEGRAGQAYNIGGGAERENLQIVQHLCDLMDTRLGRSGGAGSRKLIRFVADRPGHDRRYAIDATKIRDELNWKPRHEFVEALEKTVGWYLAHMEWVDSVRSGRYRQWIERNYGKRGEQIP